MPIYLNERDLEPNISIKEKYIGKSLDEVIMNIEKQMIMKAIEESRGNITKAASILKITRQRLHYKLSKYDIEFI